jgi:hypothetical protein
MSTSTDVPPRPRAAPGIGTDQQFRWLKGIVKWVLVLNLIDAVLTLLWVRAGLAVEANTLMDELVNEHALVFVLVKLSLVGMGSWLLWNRRESPLAVVAIFAVFLTYYAILVHHVQYASGLVRSLLVG